MASSKIQLRTHNQTLAVEINSNLACPLNLRRTMRHLTMMERTNSKEISPSLCRLEIVGILSCRCLSTCTPRSRTCPSRFRLRWQRSMDTGSSNNSAGTRVTTAPTSRPPSYSRTSTSSKWKSRGSKAPRRTASKQEEET